MALLRHYLEMVRAAHGVSDPPPLATRDDWRALGESSLTSDFARLAYGAPSDHYSQCAASIRAPLHQMRQLSD